MSVRYLGTGGKMVVSLCVSAGNRTWVSLQELQLHVTAEPVPLLVSSA